MGYRLPVYRACYGLSARGGVLFQKTVILSGAPRGCGGGGKKRGVGCVGRRAVEGPPIFSVRQARRQKKRSPTDQRPFFPCAAPHASHHPPPFFQHLRRRLRGAPLRMTVGLW